MGNLIGVHLLAMIFAISNSFAKFAIEKEPVTNFLSNEIMEQLRCRVGVKGAMGGNVTLMSDSFLGAGTISFVLPGKLDDGTPVAIKFMNDSSVYFDREYKCFEQMDATVHRRCEEFGIPFIYRTGDFLNFKTITMTLLDVDVETLHKKIGPFSEDAILILYRDLIRSVKYMHSKGVINEDIKPANVLIKGTNVFLSGMIDNMYSLKSLCKRINHPAIVQPCIEFSASVMKSTHRDRLPEYDRLYRIFDDALYASRNRSERIVFEWLTPESKAKAITEVVPSNESINFHSSRSS